MKHYDIIIIGAGAAGIGFGAALKNFGIESFVILERGANKATEVGRTGTGRTPARADKSN